MELLKTVILIPANDPFMAASYIEELFHDKILASEIGRNARILALQRHDKKIILNDLMAIYNKIKNS